MTETITVDAARLPLLLGELRLPTIGALWPQFTERADSEGWPAAKLLATLAELELAERSQRRIQRHLAEARLPPGKTLDSFEFNAVPMVNKAQITALAAGDGWLEKGANILLFGPSGCGKSHLGAALGYALIESGYRVLFTRTTDLVQRLQVARQNLSLEATIEKLDKYHLIVLDDLCYVRKDQAETSALFELIAIRSTKGEDESRRPPICSYHSAAPSTGRTGSAGGAAQAASRRSARDRRAQRRLTSADRRAEHGACGWPIADAWSSLHAWVPPRAGERDQRLPHSGGARWWRCAGILGPNFRYGLRSPRGRTSRS
jgi:DNA replication protein DnaC